MVVNNIFYSEEFEKEFKKLQNDIQKITAKKVEIFKQNPFHSSLRLHSLYGNLAEYWSISINMRIRIIFERTDNDDIIFNNIGKHDIYNK